MKKKTDPNITRWRKVLDAAEREMEAAAERTKQGRAETAGPGKQP